MKEERLQEIIGQLEAEPEKPVLLTRENEADEAYGLLWGTHPGIRLATIHGVSYLAVTDAALQVLVERLERERQQFRVTVQHYDRQIAPVVLGWTIFTQNYRTISSQENQGERLNLPAFPDSIKILKMGRAYGI